MVFRTQRTTILAALGLLGLWACGKDEETPLTTTELLQARGWRITAATAKVGNAAATDVLRPRPDCVKDNTYRFLNGNETEVNEGTLRCATADAQKTTGRWTLTDSTLTVTASASATRNYGFAGVVRSVNRTTLLVVTTQRVDTVTTVIRTTFTAQ